MRRFLPPLLVVLAAMAAYSDSLSGPFVLDDLPSIADNASLRHGWAAWSTPVVSSTHGRPLLNLSFALNYALSGPAVWSYHLLNLLIHLGCALLVYSLVRRAAGSATIGGFSAAIWAVHPLTTAAVTYTVQRAESLMGLFYLLTLECFARAFDPAATPSRARLRGWAGGWEGLAVFFCFCGMATKEVMVTAPLMVWLYDRTFGAGSFRAALRQHGRTYAGLAASWVLLAGLVLSTHGRGGTAGFGSGVSAWDYWLTQCHALAHYLRLCLWPWPLIFYYGRPVVTAPLAVLPGAALLTGLLLATLWALRRNPPAGFLGAAFFLLLAPSSSFVPVATETMAEHRMYLALIPIVILAVALLLRWLGARARWVLILATAALAATTWARNLSYQSSFGLWRETVAADPGNPWARNNLGCEYDNLPGRTREAVDQFEAALRLKPDHAEAHYNLANDLRGLPGGVPAALAHYEAALASQPAFPKAENNLAGVLAQIPGRLPEAIAHYQAAIRIDPGYAEAHFNLGNAWLQAGGREREAIGEFEAALRLRPDYSEAHNNLGQALAADPARAEAAIGHFRRAVALDPDNAAAHYNLGIMLLDRPGARAEARAQLEAAQRLHPDDASLRRLLSSLPER